MHHQHLLLLRHFIYPLSSSSSPSSSAHPYSPSSASPSSSEVTMCAWQDVKIQLITTRSSSAVAFSSSLFHCSLRLLLYYHIYHLRGTVIFFFSSSSLPSSSYYHHHRHHLIRKEGRGEGGKQTPSSGLRHPSSNLCHSWLRHTSANEQFFDDAQTAASL